MTIPDELQCLSLMELLNIAEGAIDTDGRAHLDACPRCRALLATLPASVQLPALTRSATDQTHTTKGSTAPAPASSTRTGSLWRALPTPTDDFAWVVVIIGRSPESDDRFLVAPVIGAPDTPTEQDLLLDRELLGYGAFADAANTGMVLRDQLVQPLGQLGEPEVKALKTLYRAVLGGGPAPEPHLVGTPVLDDADPRLLQADARRQSLRALWRAADRLVDAEDAEEVEDVDAPDVPTSAAGDPAEVEVHVAGLAATITGYIEGPHASWDRATLLENSGADGAHVDAFLRDELDLTDMGDVSDLARVMRSLDIEWEETERVVTASLWRSSGGVRRASGGSLPMAARGGPGQSEEEVTRALYADQTTVDTSQAARAQQVARYIAELRQALDELE